MAHGISSKMAKREFFIFITFSDTCTCTYNVCLLAIFADYHVHVHMNMYMYMYMYMYNVHCICTFIVPTQYMYVTNYDKYIFTFLGFKMSCLKDEVLVEQQ